MVNSHCCGVGAAAPPLGHGPHAQLTVLGRRGRMGGWISGSDRRGGMGG